jgi:hypothetical protein
MSRPLGDRPFGFLLLARDFGPLELPRSEAPEVDVEGVEPRKIRGAGKLNLEL